MNHTTILVNEDSTLVALRAFAPADLFLCLPVPAENSQGL